MREWQKELDARVSFIRRVVEGASASGIIYGNSGGKDSALVGILCKKAVPNTVGVIMPCDSRRNYDEDTADARRVAEAFDIETRACALTGVKTALMDQLLHCASVTQAANANIAPRLRMATLYAVAASENLIVAGTGNRSEGYLGYFTKWGDAACDFNPISDLTVGEIYDFLGFLGCPREIIEKSPSAALYDGQTDEGEMGVTYSAVDHFLTTGEGRPDDLDKIRHMHEVSAHKRKPPVVFAE